MRTDTPIPRKHYPIGAPLLKLKWTQSSTMPESPSKIIHALPY